MPRLLEVKARPGFTVRVRYGDGSKGDVDLSDLAGRGVFAVWDSPGSFESAFVGPQGQLSWSGDVELCPDTIYMRLTGKTLAQIFPASSKASTLA